MKRILMVALLLATTLLTSCELCTDPNGCQCYMDNDGDGDGDTITGRHVDVENGETCPEGYYL